MRMQRMSTLKDVQNKVHIFTHVGHLVGVSCSQLGTQPRLNPLNSVRMRTSSPCGHAAALYTGRAQ